MAKIGKRVLIKTVKGKKLYTCYDCGEPIEPGEHSIVATAQAESGEYISHRYCLMHSWKQIIADLQAEREAIASQPIKERK